MKNQFRVTYEIVTEESAIHGDFAENGFAHPHEMSLREALDVAGCGRGGYEDSGDWFTTIDLQINYATGEEARYSIHPMDVTPSSYERIRRLLCYRRQR